MGQRNFTDGTSHLTKTAVRDVPSVLSSLDGVTLGHAAGQEFGVRLGCGMGTAHEHEHAHDLAEEQWELVDPVVTAWKARHPPVSEHQGTSAVPLVFNA